MKAIIFGVNGQDGKYLRMLLEKNNIQVIGFSRSAGGNWIVGDIGDLNSVESIIKEEQPNYIFHFSATSTTNHSALFENYNSISLGTLNVLECVRLYCPNAKVFLSGSAMQFRNDGIPINENTARSH
jgi:GDPmannose 4,6-dehydratase